MSDGSMSELDALRVLVKHAHDHAFDASETVEQAVTQVEAMVDLIESEGDDAKIRACESNLVDLGQTVVMYVPHSEVVEALEAAEAPGDMELTNEEVDQALQAAMNGKDMPNEFTQWYLDVVKKAMASLIEQHKKAAK